MTLDNISFPCVALSTALCGSSLAISGKQPNGDLMRRESLLFLLLAALAATGSPDGEDDLYKDRQGRDSYLEAYQDSHGSGPTSEVVFPSPEHEGPHESPSYYTPSSPPPYTAPAPAHSYYTPSSPPPYTAPAPAHSYGPPLSPSYPVYGPPPSSVYGAPHSAPTNGFNLMGLDIHTILKILLKITIFKLIVKFITILCLLLFIPKFDMGSNTSTPMDEERRDYGVGRGGSEESINALTHLVLNAIENNSTLDTATESTADCQDNLYCNLARAAKIVDSKTSFTGVFHREASDPPRSNLPHLGRDTRVVVGEGVKRKKVEEGYDERWEVKGGLATASCSAATLISKRPARVDASDASTLTRSAPGRLFSHHTL
uniref:Uncharacterized protein n=1 Tax=Timema cristinae TaxID=61476 RepID=A0A7R9D0K6_TIMCR|nr:unnamed protein product [Timema cristinae]